MTPPCVVPTFRPYTSENLEFGGSVPRVAKVGLSSIAGPRAYPAFVGIQSDIRAMVFWYLVVLGSYRPKRADTGADTAP
jgi:hypothetical protein